MKKCPYCGKEYPDDATVCAIDQEPLQSDTPPAAQTSEDPKPDSEEPVKGNEEPEVPEGFRRLGSFDPFEAARILRQFEEAGIQFLIDRVESLRETGRGIRRQALIEICVRLEDDERANKILTADWKV